MSLVLQSIKNLKADAGSKIIVFIFIFILVDQFIKNNDLKKKRNRNNEVILNCQYCNRRVKRKNLVSGQCPFCGNQVE